MTSTTEEKKTPTPTPTPTPFTEINNIPLYFDEDWETGIGGGLWSTGLAMTNYFGNNVSQMRRHLQRLKETVGSTTGITAIELGSGNSLLSACFAAVAEGLVSELYVTDLADHLALMEEIFDLNEETLKWQKNKDETVCNSNGDVISTSGTILNDMKLIIAEHKWGEFSDAPPSGFGRHKKFDFIFGSDVAYHDHKEALISSLLELSHENTIILIGSTMYDSKPKFFRDLVQAGFRYERLSDNLMEPQFRGSNFGIFAIQRQPNNKQRL